jgi:flagellar biosynthesis protein FlhB
MAQDKNQERTEEASPKRLQEARERGQIPRSRELNTFGVLAGGVAGLGLVGPALLERLMLNLRTTISDQSLSLGDPGRMYAILWELILSTLQALAPLFVIMMVVAFLTPQLLGGWGFSTKAIAPQLDRVDPIKGIGRLFSMRALVELLKAVLKFGFIGAVGATWFWLNLDEYLALGLAGLNGGFGLGLQHVGTTISIVLLPLLVIALIDVPFQLFEHARQLKMSRQEVKEEYKETEGRPEVKGKLRQKQQELAQARMMSAVPQADAVIVNPSHYAVALQYQPETDSAPVVVAKGFDHVAEAIKRVAKEHKVAEISSPVLARALYYNVDLNAKVPADLYVAVAKVLAYVFSLRTKNKMGSAARRQLARLSVPGHFKTEAKH